MNDPIIEEIHKARSQLWDSCCHDWKALGEYLQDRSAQHPERMITRAEMAKLRSTKSRGGQSAVSK